MCVTYRSPDLLQMFGAYFYGFSDHEDAKSLLKISYLARKMDNNDYLFSNSPYTVTYVRPVSEDAAEVSSPSSPVVNFVSLVDMPEERQCR